MKFSKDISYTQQIIKVSPNEICVNWRGNTPSCAKNGATSTEAWIENESTESKNRDSFRAQFDGDVVTLVISELVMPKDPAGITITKAVDGLYFAYKGVELNQPLPLKYDTEDNRKTWALYAITNVEYWGGRWFSDYESFMVGGDTYKSWHARANDEPSYEYIFNTKTLTLKSRSLTDDFDSSHRFECQIWKKQHWWQF
ncbi:hypothetical protein [Polynucleobacter sp. UB-Siik-W21]|uniref:hypothetical protein n=1 Tax=Polynucleobacter sp. UB-Siik-W21 TaxID=1855646 RepID=UPI001BFE767F|nr:hypothetical protein [Polynucleobacter sp. UB-Siik-W21]QWD69610.1 hypothetical protein C2756_06695 [Polynucleobacter sp. UB-Siik-W21]